MHSRGWTGGRSRVRAGPADPNQALGGVAGGGSARRFGGLPPTFGPELRDSAGDRGFPGGNCQSAAVPEPWADRVWLAGTERSAQYGGYLEGALDAAIWAVNGLLAQRTLPSQVELA